MITGDDIIKTRRYRISLHLRYFEHGYGKLGMLKYIFAALFLVDYSSGLAAILFYGLLSYLIGRLLYHRFHGISMTEIEAEINNRYNKFQEEMRKKYTH